MMELKTLMETLRKNLQYNVYTNLRSGKHISFNLFYFFQKKDIMELKTEKKKL